jgi:hypothetical protein
VNDNASGSLVQTLKYSLGAVVVIVALAVVGNGLTGMLLGKMISLLVRLLFTGHA